MSTESRPARDSRQQYLTSTSRLRHGRTPAGRQRGGTKDYLGCPRDCLVEKTELSESSASAESTTSPVPNDNSPCNQLPAGDWRLLPSVEQSTRSFGLGAARAAAFARRAARVADPDTLRRNPLHRATLHAPVFSLTAPPAVVPRRRQGAATAKAHGPLGVGYQTVDRAYAQTLHTVVAEQRVDYIDDGERLALADGLLPAC